MLYARAGRNAKPDQELPADRVAALSRYLSSWGRAMRRLGYAPTVLHPGPTWGEYLRRRADAVPLHECALPAQLAISHISAAYRCRSCGVDAGMLLYQDGGKGCLQPERCVDTAQPPQLCVPAAPVCLLLLCACCPPGDLLLHLWAYDASLAWLQWLHSVPVVWVDKMR